MFNKIMNYAIRNCAVLSLLVFLPGILLLLSLDTFAGAATLQESYPRIADGFLKKSKLEKLEKGTILSSKDVVIKESDITELVSKVDPKVKDQIQKSLFFVLDHEATRRFLVMEARKGDAQPTESEDEAIKRYLTGKASSVTASDDEIKKFYEENKAALGGVSFDQVQGEIKNYLSELKRQEAVQSAVLGLAEGKDIRLDSEWVKKNYELAIDNPVEKARGTGIPSMVEFGASGCKPCDMMQPILEKLRKKYEGKLNVVFLQVGEEQILGARYGIRTIPVQAFYDKDGKEFHRHVGFYPEADVEEVISKMGVK